MGKKQTRLSEYTRCLIDAVGEDFDNPPIDVIIREVITNYRLRGAELKLKDVEIKTLTERIQALERENAGLVTENSSLKARLADLGEQLKYYRE